MYRPLPAVLLLTGLCLSTVLAYNPKLNIAEVRGWSRWDATITSVDWQVTIDGLMARNVVTMVFKDTLSSTSFDSLELSYNFDLTEDAVVDSMYLWMNETPVPALILKKEQAQQIYEGIVNRRRDPALLTRNGSTNNYDLKIFPFQRRGSRMVRLCYYAPLVPLDGRLALSVPIQMAGQSYYPIADVSLTVLHLYAPPTAVQVSLPQGFALSQWQQSGSGTLVSTRARNVKPPTAMTVSAAHARFGSQGLAVQFCRDAAGELSFLALLDPTRMVGYTGAAGRFYPASLDVDANGSGFVYDLFGPLVTSYVTSQTVALVGRLHNDNSLTIAFNGMLAGRDYSFRGTAFADAAATTDRGVSELWAWRKASGLALAATTASAQEATELSFSAHILTQYTALLALEPNMVPGIADGQTPGSNPGGGVALGTTQASAAAAPAISVERLAGAVLVNVTGIAGRKAGSLKVYNLSGKLVADLSDALRSGTAAVRWDTAGVVAGMYVVRLVVEGTVVSAMVSVGR